MLVTAVPNWSVGETFSGSGETFRIREIRTELLPEMLDAGSTACSPFEPT